MESFLKLMMVVSIAVFLVTIIPPTSSAENDTTTTEADTTAAPDCCNSGNPPTPTPVCTAQGNFKSNSTCYYDSKTNTYVPRYDYYTCVRNGKGGYYPISRKNCTGTTGCTSNYNP